MLLGVGKESEKALWPALRMSKNLDLGKAKGGGELAREGGRQCIKDIMVGGE